MLYFVLFVILCFKQLFMHHLRISLKPNGKIQYDFIRFKIIIFIMQFEMPIYFCCARYFKGNINGSESKMSVGECILVTI